MRPALAFCLALAPLACGSGSGVPSYGPLGDALAASASSSGAPRDLLVAIAVVEGGLAMPAHRDVRPDDDVPAAGPLMLRRGKLDTLARAAALSGQPELALRRDADLALDAGARVLAELGAAAGATVDLATWEQPIEEMSGYEDDLHRREYAHRVFAVLAAGGAFEGRDGEKVVVPPHGDVPVSLAVDLGPTIRAEGAEYPGAEWFPTSCANKCDTTRGGNSITGIAIHDTECGWDAAVATLQNDPGKSVHYIVGTDGRVGQFIPESYTGWGVGNYWYNQRTVSIEHVGYTTKPFTEAEYAASAKLVDYLAKKYGVARDRAHVIGHDQVPDGTHVAQSAAPCSDSPSACEKSGDYGGSAHHTDPGDWEWATYMPRIGGSAKCNDVTGLWSCGWDGERAFRCAGGKVEVRWCNGPKGCVTEPNGQDDLCDQASLEPPPSATAHSPPPGSAPPPAPPPAGGPDGRSNASGGCSAAPTAPSAGAAILLSAGLGLRRRSRRRR